MFCKNDKFVPNTNLFRNSATPVSCRWANYHTSQEPHAVSLKKKIFFTQNESFLWEWNHWKLVPMWTTNTPKNLRKILTSVPENDEWHVLNKQKKEWKSPISAYFNVVQLGCPIGSENVRIFRVNTRIICRG